MTKAQQSKCTNYKKCCKAVESGNVRYAVGNRPSCDKCSVCADRRNLIESGYPYRTKACTV